jgi:hypothetical protein
VTDLLDAALDYARRGWPVFPVEPGGKRPLGRLVPHGLKTATTDHEVIRRWWRAEPRANVGLVTGAHFDVLDLDGPDALDAFENAGPVGNVTFVDGLPVHEFDVDGPTVATPRGWHCYVGPSGRGNTVNVGGLSGVDWRGRGGYVVAPPSVRADCGTWSWITGTPLDLGPDTPIRPAPGWVLRLLDRRDGHPSPPPSIPIRRHGGLTGYGAAALEGEVANVVTATKGARNGTLNAAAFKLGSLVATGALAAEEVAAVLYHAGRAVGLGERETIATVRSGMSAGMRSPRAVAS